VNFYDWDPSLGNVKWWNGQTFAGARAKSRLGDYVGDNHTGTDFAAKAGTVIPSPASGQVTFTSVTNGSMWVQLAHDNGFSTSYNHVSKTLVELGQAVKKGQPIALVGESGTWYPHLHFELLLPIYDHLAILDPFRPVWPLDMASSGYWGFDNGRVWWVRVPPTENPNGLGYWIGGNPNE
jgi:murein DD-endopeptidase MepM/ murein hydrolase activator NlpD